MVRKIYILCIATLFFQGCLKLKDKSQNQDSHSGETLVIQNDQSEIKIQTEFAPMSEPGFYEAHFFWTSDRPVKLKHRGYVIYDSTSDKSKELHWKNEAPDEKMEIEIIDLLTGLVAKIEVIFPHDIVINDVKTLEKNEIWEAQRVYLEENSVIETLGFNLSIIAQEFYAKKNSSLQAFYKNPQAFVNQEGLSAGHLNIEVLNQMEGDLLINIQGQQGGSGLPGGQQAYDLSYYISEVERGGGQTRWIPCPGLNGKKSGQNGSLQVKVPSLKNIRLQVLNSAVSGGDPGVAGGAGTGSSVGCNLPETEVNHKGLMSNPGLVLVQEK